MSKLESRIEEVKGCIAELDALLQTEESSVMRHEYEGYREFFVSALEVLEARL